MPRLPPPLGGRRPGVRARTALRLRAFGKAAFGSIQEVENMESGNRKHRYSYCGMKGVVEESKHGAQVARERYGKPTASIPKPEDRSEPQRLGDKNNLRGPSWRDDTANDWR